jgi:tRNA pseudouridine55 synthase
MLLGVGAGTKRLAELIKLDKEYIAEVRFGESRTTGDMEGEILDEYDVTDSVEQLQHKAATALATFKGVHTLPVSAYSAIKVDGVPMYKRARQAAITNDTIINIPMRQMTVHKVELMDVHVADERGVATVRFQVASGTYIRSLAEELGRNLGYPACLQNLRRTKVGEYRLEDAYQLDDLK